MMLLSALYELQFDCLIEQSNTLYNTTYVLSCNSLICSSEFDFFHIV